MDYLSVRFDFLQIQFHVLLVRKTGVHINLRRCQARDWCVHRPLFNLTVILGDFL